MPLKKIRSFLVLAALSLTFSLSAASQPTQQRADQLQQKIDAIADNAAAEPVRNNHTVISQEEVDSYLAFHAKEKLANGLSQPEIHLLGGNRISGRIVVDLDEFKRQRGSHGITDPFFYLSGKAPIRARGLLHSQNGRGQFQLESAEIHGIPVPNQVVQELVSFFSRTPENPQGIRIDSPLDLPAKIRHVTIKPGEAVIVQ